MDTPMCPICEERAATHQATVQLKSAITGFYVVAVRVRGSFLRVPTCGRCKWKVVGAHALKRWGFVAFGFVAALALLFLALGVGGGAPEGLITAAILGAVAAGLFGLYLWGARLLRAYLRASGYAE